VRGIAISIVFAGLLVGVGTFFGLRGFGGLSRPVLYVSPVTRYIDTSLSVTLDGTINVNQ
jgi:hypothetical protein